MNFAKIMQEQYDNIQQADREVTSAWSSILSIPDKMLGPELVCIRQVWLYMKKLQKFVVKKLNN